MTFAMLIFVEDEQVAGIVAEEQIDLPRVGETVRFLKDDMAEQRMQGTVSNVIHNYTKLQQDLPDKYSYVSIELTNVVGPF